MSDTLAFALLCLTSFFTLINPIGTMPIFMTMTANLDPKSRSRTALKASIVAFLTLILFSFSGQLLFQFFGISVNSFRVVGGVIFFLMGMDMLQARLNKVKVRKQDVHTYVNDISVTPLAIPMIAGPGSMTNAIVLMEDAGNSLEKAILIGSIFLVMTFTYLILFSSTRIIRVLGDTGNTVLMRLMGLIVMVIAVEFLFSGLKPILQDIFQIN
ncbi:MAG: MarC family protein [Saprospiraceae bacterium]|nr:NAAT family transporter [Saprospiraceae bacterium]MCB9312938.1 NAAT family transporter [Lewinellaceae bacterium]HRW74381.1 MarC family protein [Saprospiraceae bacterium]